MTRTYMLLFSDASADTEYVVFTEDPIKKWRQHAKPGCTLDAAFDLSFVEPVRATGRMRKHFSIAVLPQDQPMIKEH